LKKLYFYTHTHWDREWYRPLEDFRAQLLEVVRGVLDALDRDELSCFYLDGQTIIFDDVIALDPSLKTRLAKHMAAGKLFAGPWYVLADQMLVGGESLIRNIAFGLKSAQSLGKAAMAGYCRVGYCPDTFGHTQDMPRLLAGFGISHAAVWRGAPKLTMGPLFYWYSPDGSKVLTCHLTHGYYQTSLHEYATKYGVNGEGLEKFARQVASWVSESNGGRASSFCRTIDGALMPVGGDHAGVPPRLSLLIGALNEHYRKLDLEIELLPVDLESFMGGVAKEIESADQVVEAIHGELRDNRSAPAYDRAYLLPGVLSSRLYLKRANAGLERKLIRRAEPILTFLSMDGCLPYPQGELTHAWKMLLANHPHDSICGCSIDAVHAQMESRFQQIDELTDSLLDKAGNAIAGGALPAHMSVNDPEFESGGLCVFNCGSSASTQPVPFSWTAKLDDRRQLPGDLVQIDNRQAADSLFSGWGLVPYYKEVDNLTGWIWPGPVPPLGLSRLNWPPSATASQLRAQEEIPLAKAALRRLTNGHLSLTVEADGTLKVTSYAGAKPHVYSLGHRLRDIGDGGDSYNFDPLAKDKPVSAKLKSVKVGRKGPLVASLILTYEILLPVQAISARTSKRQVGAKPSPNKVTVLKRSPKKVRHKIVSEVILKRGVPIVFFETAFENQAADHRLEVVFATGKTVDCSYSENHFSLVRRKHQAKKSKIKLPVPEGSEAEPDRFPCQRFFIANGQIFFNQGLPEYGVEGGDVSITLVRAVSFLSRKRLFTRGGGAGPGVSVPAANCLRLNRSSYGWAPLVVPAAEKSPASLAHTTVIDAHRLAENYEGLLFAAKGPGLALSPTIARERAGESWLAVDNAAIRTVSLHVDAGAEGKESAVVWRLLNVTLEEQKATVRFAGSYRLKACRLDGTYLAEPPLRGDGQSPSAAVDIVFGGNELKTFRLIKL
jgi:hypothetical protein